jgi:hypothetical protein
MAGTISHLSLLDTLGAIGTLLGILATVVPVLTFWWHFAALVVIAVAVIALSLHSTATHSLKPWSRIGISLIALGVIAWAMWVPMRKQYMQEHLSPSFVFVFGAPLGENDSAMWMMFLKHYGPGPALGPNTIDFQDADREQLLRNWALKHPLVSPPSGLIAAAQTQKMLPTEGPTLEDEFNWRPLNPDHQHYTVGISSRDETFTEDWQVARVKGALRTRLKIVRTLPESKEVIFECADADLPTADPSAAPLSRQPAAFVPPFVGWRPYLKTPVVIVPYNGHLYWGSSAGDSACWQAGSQHLGDAALPLALPPKMPAENRVMWKALVVFTLVFLAGLYSLFAFWLMGQPLLDVPSSVSSSPDNEHAS